MQPDTNPADRRAERLAGALKTLAGKRDLDAAEAKPLRQHDSGIYLLPRANVVVRLFEATSENRQRAELAVRVTEWLIGQGFPATEPAHPEPREADGMVATFWSYLPQPANQAPPAARAKALGSLLRKLHALPAPPLRLPTLDPLARLRTAIELDGQRAGPVLSRGDRAFFAARTASLADAYAALDFRCGSGLIHNDAHIGNLLAADSPHGYVLTDWESVHWGPREVDLVLEGAPGNRFGESAAVRLAFSDAYGYDIATWDGWPVLRDLRDLHSLAAYIRSAPYKPTAAHELRRRLASLQAGDRNTTWYTVD